MYTESLWQGRSDIAHMSWYALYLLVLNTLALGAGACTLMPRTRQLIGPGLLSGIVAASTWSLVFLVSDRLRYNGILGDGWWYEIVAHLVLVLAACLAGFALPRPLRYAWFAGLPGSACLARGHTRLCRRPGA